MLEAVAGTGGDHEHPVLLRVTVDNEAPVGRPSVETGGRLDHTGRDTSHASPDMVPIHPGRLRRIDNAIHGVRRGAGLVLFGRYLETPVAGHRREAVQVVAVGCAGHPDEDG